MSSSFIKKFIPPVALILVALLWYFGWQFLGLPTQDELIVIARSYFERYGLVVVFISAIIEGALMLGFYYPGSLVIFLGVIFAAGDIVRVLEVILVTILGTSIAYAINFLIGRHGWCRLLNYFGMGEQLDKAKARLQSHEVGAVFASYWHPNFAAITSTAAGILNLNFRRFFLISLGASVCWNFFWGTLAAVMGKSALKVIGPRFILVIVFVWIAYIIWNQMKKPVAVAPINPTILYEDPDILAINKPAGLVVHPDGRTKEPSVSEWFVAAYPGSRDVGEKMGEIERPGVVHRIDRETSGVLLLAKTKAGHKFLKEQFQNREMKKVYHVFVHGNIKEDRGTINLAIGRSASDFRKWSATRGARGEKRDAITYFEVLKRSPEHNVCLVEAKPKTGRTHQIRVHFLAVQNPVVGDNLYAPSKPPALGFNRVALHARRLSFNNLRDEEITVEAPYPEDFQKALDILG